MALVCSAFLQCLKGLTYLRDKIISQIIWKAWQWVHILMRVALILVLHRAEVWTQLRNHSCRECEQVWALGTLIPGGAITVLWGSPNLTGHRPTLRNSSSESTLRRATLSTLLILRIMDPGGGVWTGSAMVRGSAGMSTRMYHSCVQHMVGLGLWWLGVSLCNLRASSSLGGLSPCGPFRCFLQQGSCTSSYSLSFIVVIGHQWMREVSVQGRKHGAIEISGANFGDQPLSHFWVDHFFFNSSGIGVFEAQGKLIFIKTPLLYVWNCLYFSLLEFTNDHFLCGLCIFQNFLSVWIYWHYSSALSVL